MSQGRRRTSLAILPESFNRLRDPLEIVACWSMGGSTFGFADFYLPRSTKPAFEDFAATHAANPQGPVALFGHTDSAGSVNFNHDLSWARAQTVYGVLRNDPDIWVTLYGEDGEARARLRQQLTAEGYDVDPSEKGVGPTMTAAIAQHVAYLADGLALDVFDFLGEHGQFSMQACSEFNPLRRLGLEIAERCSPAMKNAALATNRRVVAFWFAPGTHVDGAWPCPVPGEGPDKCKSRLWSDAKQRNKEREETLEFWPTGVKGSPPAPIVRSEETFACRFYDRVAHRSPCEVAEPWKPPPEDPIIITDEPDPPDPPLPDIPDLPHPPHPPVPPEPPPPPPRKLIDWTVELSCSHGSGTRFNSGRLKSLGRSVGTSDDLLQVVPESGGDTILVSVDPASSMNHVDITVDKKLLSWMGSGKSSASFVAKHVKTTMDHPISLYARFKAIRPKNEILVEGAKGSATATVERFPDKEVSADAEIYLDTIRFFLKPLVATIQKFGDMFSEDFKIKLFEDEDTELAYSAQWREWPNPKHFDPSVMDYRVFYGYRAVFALDPLVHVKGTLIFSALQLLKRLGQFKHLKKLIERLLRLLPKWVKDALEAISFKLTPKFGGGGRFEQVRERPEEKLLEVSDRKGADHWEIPAFFGVKAELTATLEELLKGKVDNASVSISVKFDAGASLGFIADMVREEAGLYADASISDVEIEVELGIPFIGHIKDQFTPIESERWGPERWIFFEGDGT